MNKRPSKSSEPNLILGLDVSTKTIGIALFEDRGESGKIKLLHHIAPNPKPKRDSKIQELCDKANIFRDEFLMKYKDFNITKVIIEEPLLRSNNVNTIATLLRFNGMISRDVYEILGIVPEFISSYDARAYAFPELMAVRTHNKKGEAYPEKELKNKTTTLFGAYPWDVDKKEIIWNLVANLEPQITWLYNNKNVLKKETYDTTDAYCCVLGQMRKLGIWK